MYNRAITKLLATVISILRHVFCVIQSVPKCGSMRLKMASAVEGCLYRRLNVVPGRPSRYSNDRRDDADIFLRRL